MDDAVTEDVVPEARKLDSSEEKMAVSEKVGLVPVKTERRTIQTSRLFYEGKILKKEEFHEDLVEVAIHEKDVALAQISYTTGLTLTTAPYESAKISVSCTLPCYVEEMSEAFEVAKGFVELRIKREASSIREYRDKIKTRE